MLDKDYSFSRFDIDNIVDPIQPTMFVTGLNVSNAVAENEKLFSLHCSSF